MLFSVSVGIIDFLVAQMVKNLPVNAGDARDIGDPGLGRSPGVGNGNPL